MSFVAACLRHRHCLWRNLVASDAQHAPRRRAKRRTNKIARKTCNPCAHGKKKWRSGFTGSCKSIETRLAAACNVKAQLILLLDNSQYWTIRHTAEGCPALVALDAPKISVQIKNCLDCKRTSIEKLILGRATCLSSRDRLQLLCDQIGALHCLLSAGCLGASFE